MGAVSGVFGASNAGSGFWLWLGILRFSGRFLGSQPAFARSDPRQFQRQGDPLIHQFT
jgi:hypothetical protein